LAICVRLGPVPCVRGAYSRSAVRLGKLLALPPCSAPFVPPLFPPALSSVWSELTHGGAATSPPALLRSRHLAARPHVRGRAGSIPTLAIGKLRDSTCLLARLALQRYLGFRAVVLRIRNRLCPEFSSRYFWCPIGAAVAFEIECRIVGHVAHSPPPPPLEGLGSRLGPSSSFQWRAASQNSISRSTARSSVLCTVS